MVRTSRHNFTRFGAAVEMLRLKYGFPTRKQLLEELAEQGDAFTNAQIHNWLYGLTEVNSDFPAALAELLGLEEGDPDHQLLANAFAYGQKVPARRATTATQPRA